GLFHARSGNVSERPLEGFLRLERWRKRQHATRDQSHRQLLHCPSPGKPWRGPLSGKSDGHAIVTIWRGGGWTPPVSRAKDSPRLGRDAPPWARRRVAGRSRSG